MKSLLDSSESVQDLSSLRPVEACELRHLFGRCLDHPGSFSESVFKPGSKDLQLFESLKKLKPFRPRCPGITHNGDIHICPGVFPESDNPHSDQDDLGVEVGAQDHLGVGVDGQGDLGALPGLAEDAEKVGEEAHSDTELVAPELEGSVSLVNPSHPYHLRSRSRSLARGAQVAGGPAPADAHLDHHSEPNLTQAVEGARRLRPRKVVKYTYANIHKQLRFNRKVFVREF